MDGIYGSLVIRQPPNKDPNSHLYDFDLTTHVILLSDWMHEDASERFPGRLAVNTGEKICFYSDKRTYANNMFALNFNASIMSVI